MIIEVNAEHPSHYRINRLVKLLQEGGVLAIPTDTCYALACLPQKKSAVDQLIRLRNLDQKKPRALVFSSIQQISMYTMLSDVSFKILRRFLPGPYCFILESNRKLPRFIGNKRQHIGVRFPSQKVVQALISELDSPLTVTSAIDPESDNMLYDPWSIESTFGHGLAAVVDSGEVPGQVSSIVSLIDDQCEILRVGLGDVSAFE